MPSFAQKTCLVGARADDPKSNASAAADVTARQAATAAAAAAPFVTASQAADAAGTFDAAANVDAATVAVVQRQSNHHQATVEPPSGETVAVVAAPILTDAVVVAVGVAAVEAAAVDTTDRAVVGDAAPVDASAPAAAVDRAEGAVPAAVAARAATQVTPVLVWRVFPPFVQ